MKKINLAIVGATGMVGRTFLKVLEERNFPYNKLFLFASKNSAGKILTCKGEEYTVLELTEDSFKEDIDIALFSAGGEISAKFSPIAAKNGVVVVDNSSAFRMDDNVPLVVPEVNPEAILNSKGIIANPNCSTIQAMVALSPIHKKYGIKRIVYSTYQSVSGSGVKGVSDLDEGLKGNIQLKAYPHQIANNCIPHIDVFEENGYTKEEMKMINETKKILNDYSLKITATAVRVPVYYAHSESINIELKKPFEIEDIIKLYQNTEGLILRDDISKNIYPLASEAENTDEVYVGRVRRDFSVENGLNIWVVADNIRKGAATNTIQIAEKLINL
ncbi:MAG: aspartate-semialdehyde dehydrogenase [Bacillota bacterium]|nr:aspartate-semialdehyde dehydrogenase [Bacillota bacterium]